MLQLRKGIRLECLRRPFKRALEIAARLGADGVEINARTEVKPADMSRTAVRHLRKLLGDFHLQICCVSYPTRRSLGTADELDRRIEGVKNAMAMAYDLGCPTVSNPLGRIPDEKSVERQTMTQALEEIGRHGQRVGATLAYRSCDEDSDAVLGLIQSLSVGALAVDFDPAELLMGKQDVERAMRNLGSYVAHFRARDAVRDLTKGQGLEVQLGRGSIDLPPLLAILEEHGYAGFITVDRQPGDETEAQCGQALGFLDQLFS